MRKLCRFKLSPFVEQNCIIRPVYRNIFHIQSRSIVKRRLPGVGVAGRVGPKNWRIKLLNFTRPNRKVNQFIIFRL